jgi:hypothetical protein
VARGTLDLDLAAVRPHDVLDDAQPQTAALLLARKPIVHAIELEEDALVLGHRDALPVVLH